MASELAVWVLTRYATEVIDGTPKRNTLGRGGGEAGAGTTLCQNLQRREGSRMNGNGENKGEMKNSLPRERERDGVRPVNSQDVQASVNNTT